MTIHNWRNRKTWLHICKSALKNWNCFWIDFKWGHASVTPSTVHSVYVLKWGCVGFLSSYICSRFPDVIYFYVLFVFLFQQHNEDNVIFVVQENHIFGSLHDADHGKFSIKPCPYNETCHILMQKMPWYSDQKLE